ncbi:expressed unknown protein [Seminavis robusta]|uniref:Tellurite resistance protein TerB n=1 Tax=Seminavis robusta TaxID=568900 RepID=A0A9N8DTP9_9STRA|nr:expressed unknown protein [Seminavis robusta]|eukprot:Sro282_g107450.1 n/a (212) ;mRNA; r:29471-30106
MADLLLLGQEETRKTIDKANIYCPFCRQHQICKEKELGLYVSFFFVPIKRAAVFTKYFKCQTCRKRFPAYGPDWENLEQRVAMEFLMLTCMVRVRMANGAFRKEPEGVAVGQQFLIFAHTVVGEADVVERAIYMKKVTGADKGLEEDLIPMVIEKLSIEQREHILRSMAAVTLSEGKVNDREARVFEEAGRIFGLEEKIVAKYVKKKKKKR